MAPPKAKPATPWVDLETILREAWAVGLQWERCIVCGLDRLELIEAHGRLVLLRGHHVLRRQIIEKDSGLEGEALVRASWDLRNRAVICDPCHESHHNGLGGQIPLTLIDAKVPTARPFAEALGLVHRLERDYS
jgi:hypothetical protein